MAVKSIGIFNAFLMAALILFWGSSFVIVKIALREGLTPFSIATYRFLIAGGLFITILFCRKSLKKHSKLFIEKKDSLKLILLALSGVTLFFAAQYTGIQMAGAATAAILVCFLAPILITTSSTLILGEQLTRIQGLGIATAAIGTLVVIAGGTLNIPRMESFLFGSLILLLTPVLWTGYSLLGKKTMEKYDPFLLTSYITLIGGLLLIPFSLADNSLHLILTMNLNSWFAILFLATTCSLMGYYIWFYVLKQAGAVITSSFLFAEPLVTTLLAAALVGEEIRVSTIGGGLLIFIGVYLVTRNRHTAQ